jgi:TPR repeat protein
MNKITVLFFAADPLSAPPHGTQPSLLLGREVRTIRKMLRAAEFRDRVEVDVRWAARPDDLLQALNETQPQIVHFSGHGGEDGLVLEGEDGNPHPVDAETLEEIFRVFAGDIQVVLLNACFSFTQAKAIANSIGCAIGTRDEISDEAAIAFSASFYRAIGFGKSVQAAFEQARLALRMKHVAHSEYPEIIPHGVDPALLIPLRLDSHVAVIPPAPPEPVTPEPTRAASPEMPDRPLGLLSAPQPPRSGWVFPAIVWMLSLGVALTRVENLGWALALSFFLLFLTAALLYVAHTGRARWLTRGRAVAAAILLSAGAVYFGANVLNGELAAAKRLYRAESYEAALPIFQKLAGRGDPEAMGFLGIMYMAGQGAPPDDTLGIRLLDQAARERDPRAMYALGIAYEKGEGVEPDANQAMRLYKAAAGKGNADAMNKAGELYRLKRVAGASDQEALSWYRKSAHAGSVDGMANYGWMHELGLATRRDTDEAFRWYHRAARKGSPRAMVDLGWMYERGIGRKPDAGEARKWYQKAAKLGDADGMNNLGVLYQEGRGVPRDRPRAIGLFCAAHAAGSAEAAENLARLGGGAADPAEWCAASSSSRP